MMTDKNCRVLSGDDRLAVAQGVNKENIYWSPYIGIRDNGTIIEECFFHGNVWRYVVVHEPEMKVVELPEAYFGLSNAWYVNFFHFMTEMMPKLYLYSKYGLDCPILIPPANNLVRDVLRVLNVPDSQVIEMNKGTKFKVGKLHYDEYSKLRGDALDKFQIQAFKEMRKNLYIESDAPGRNLYIARRDDKNLQNGNTKNGINRVIVNEDEILREKLPDYEVDSVGNMSFAEKAELLKDVERIVTPFGGGVMNLIIAPRLKRIQILAPDKHKHLCGWFEKSLKAVMPDLDVSIVWGKFIDDHDGIDVDRSPYLIPIDKVSP